MLESLGSTRRQDRILHGAAKAVNLVVGIVLTPLLILSQRLSRPVRRALARLEGSAVHALPVPQQGEQTMAALDAELNAIPHRLAPSRTAELRKGWTDWSSFFLSQSQMSANLGYSYPRQFFTERVAGADGVPIAATFGLHDEPRPGIVVVHGLFSSRLFDYVREIVIRAYFDWGFNVCAIDLRSFGLTDMLSDAPSTAGWKEGEDIVSCARRLKEHGSTSAGALGISLGASSVMGACHAEGAEEALDGGVLAICGPADTHRAAAYVSRTVPRSHPFYGMSLMFRSMLVQRVRSGRWPKEIDDFIAPMELVSAPWYGVSPEEIWERSSAVNHIRKARVPTLVLHSEDDAIVPVEHARMLVGAVDGVENVRVRIMPGGAHAAFDAVDPDWTWRTYRTFFERWAHYPQRTDAAPDEKVYAPVTAGSWTPIDRTRENDRANA